MPHISVSKLIIFMIQKNWPQFSVPVIALTDYLDINK